MKLYKLLLAGLILTAVLSGESRIKYLKQDADIEFIGKEDGYARITVPKEIVEYEPELKTIENSILYTDRTINKESCVIDSNEHEYCPIDTQSCGTQYDSVDGTSERHDIVKIADPFCQDGDTETIKHDSLQNVTYLECSQDNDGNMQPDISSQSNPQISQFEAIDTVAGEGDWDTSLVPGAVVQRKNPDSPTFFVYSPTSTDRDNMVLEGDLSINTSYATENPNDDDWIGFVFGFKDKNNYHYLSWRRNSTITDSSSPWTGFTLGRVVDGTLPWNHADTTSNTVLQRNTSEGVYGWENLQKYRVKIVYNAFYIKAYISKYNTDGIRGAYEQVIDYNPESQIDISGKMGFMNHSNGGAIYQGFTANYCPIGYAVDGDAYQCKREPKCGEHYNKIRLGDIGVIRCEMPYTYYDYTCPDEVNIYGNNYEPTDRGGDCGHILCTNTEVPPSGNCKRLRHECPIDPNSPCVMEEEDLDYNDFYKWTVENYQDRTDQSDWEVYEKNSVVQHKNGVPTYFLSNYELEDGNITMEGTFRTDDPVDNDFFGFVFGYKNISNYHLLSWSRWKNDTWRANHDWSNALDVGEPFVDPVDGEIPLVMAKVTNYSGGNWHRVDIPGSYDVLQRYNNGGWSTGVTYKIKMEISKYRVKVWIGEEGHPMELNIDYQTTTPLDITGKLGFYNYSISKVTYEDFLIEWTKDDLSQTFKRPLMVPTVSGGYKDLEYGQISGTECGDDCGDTLSKIYSTNEHKLCMEDRNGNSGCFEFSNDCNFSGNIEEAPIGSSAIYSFLNSPGEDVPSYHNDINVVDSSPTGIALQFLEKASSVYPLGSIEHSVDTGGKRTVDFWMNWDGKSQGSVFSFGTYGLWLSSIVNDVPVFGFNNKDGNIRGFKCSGLAGGWHRITAVFTQGDIATNRLFVDGVEQPLSDYVVRGIGTIDGQREYTGSDTSGNWRGVWKVGSWGYNEYLPVDTSAVYSIQGTLDISGHQGSAYGANVPRQYVGVRNYDIDHNRISSRNYLRYGNASDTRFSRDLNPGDTKMYVNSAQGWDNGPGMWYVNQQHSHSFIWYGYTNSLGYTYPDYTYTRYESGPGAWPEGGIKDLGNGEWEITLKSGWWGSKISAGTAVRNMRWGRGEIWALWRGASLTDGTYTNSHTFGGGVAEPTDNGNQTFMPGAAYIKPVLLFNRLWPYTTESATLPTVTLRDLTMASSSSGSVTRENVDSNMMQDMHLSGSSDGANGMYTGMIAGINIYAGELSADGISNLHSGGISSGITYLKVNHNSIEGFNPDNKYLGAISSSCKLSGKVGDFSHTIEVPVSTEKSKTYNNYKLNFGYLTETGTCVQKDYALTFNIDNIGEVRQSVLSHVKFDDLTAIWVNDNLVYVGPYGGNGLDKEFVESGPLSYYRANYGTGVASCELGTVWDKDVNIDIRQFLKEGDNTIKIRLIVSGHGGIGATFDFDTLKDNLQCSGGCELVDMGANETINYTEVDMVEKLISYPITSAKVVNGKIEFWDRFTRGSIGHIEPMKYVSPGDQDEGYMHEYYMHTYKLYNEGFTAFKTSENNITYAISNEPMPTSECLQKILNTGYYLSDRNLSDEIEMGMIHALSPYHSGEFRDFCVVEKNGAYSNVEAEYGIKELVKHGVFVRYVCSPWTCESHTCGVASCKEGFEGNIIKEQDRVNVLNSVTCISQDCDINTDYFSVCGNKSGCPDVAGIHQKESGECVQRTCGDNGTLNSSTGLCEKLGCKDSIDAGDGTCYKKQ